MTTLADRYRKRIIDNPCVAPTASLTWAQRRFGALHRAARKKVRSMDHRYIYKFQTNSLLLVTFARRHFHSARRTLRSLTCLRRVKLRALDVVEVSVLFRGRYVRFSSQQEKCNFTVIFGIFTYLVKVAKISQRYSSRVEKAISRDQSCWRGIMPQAEIVIFMCDLSNDNWLN